LGYERPDKLRTKAAGLVGLVVPELTNPVFPAFAQHIETHLAEAGYTPLLGTQAPGGATEEQYIDAMVERHVDGIIFVSGLHADSRADTAWYDRLLAMDIPFVVMNGTNPRIPAPAFSIDERRSMDIAVRHLHSLGHTRIGLATGQERYIPTQGKMRGFRDSMRRQLEQADPPVVNTLFTLEGGRAAAGMLLDQGCTAIVCGSDLMALGAIQLVRSRGLQAPDDVSVVGFDDSPLIAFTDPPLTTLRQPVEPMCRSAVTTLVSMIEGGPAPRTEILFLPELIVRGSTGPAPGERA
ncbi:MAG: LacI family transcriptional regulator, partial [Actinobacteria bacterium]|nr:LacI family transcriptional regulator [Actinomycetota bacterium]